MESSVSEQASKGMLRSPFQFIVKPVDGKRYANIEKIAGEEIITSTDTEDFKASNRLAEVLSVPLNYKGEIERGDLLVVHHNVFKYYYDMNGRQKSGKSFFQDDIYLLDDDQFYMFNKDGKWRAKKGICFVKPVPMKHPFLILDGEFQPLQGEVVYGSETSDKMGLYPGTKVSFLPETEYEFRIEGKLLYRMFTDHVCMEL
jgi:hypothetical protein